MKRLNTVESFLAITLLAATLGFVAPAALAQDKSPNSSQQGDAQPASSPQKSPAPESNNTRARRAVPDSPDRKAGEPSTTVSESTAKNLAGERQTAPDTEILALREEINAAPNEQERSRLQLRLVERLVARNMKQEAIAELQSMSGEDRFNPQGFYNIANAQARLGDSEGAVNTYRKAIEQRKGRYSRASNNLGVVLMRLGRWDESYDAFMSALRQESFRYAEASYNLGRLYAARGESDLAVREWRRAVAVDPEHVAAARALAGAGSAGNITVAARAPRPAAGGPSGATRAPEKKSLNSERERPAIEKKSATASMAPSKPRPAVARAPREFAVDPQTYAFLQRGRAARERGRNEDAVDNYRRVIARMGGYFPPANLELGYSLITLRRNDEAVASLLPVALKDGERFPISYYHLARLYELRGELKLAEDHYSHAAESYGESNSQFLLDVTRVREKLGNLSGALASLEKYLAILERQGQKPIWSAERLAALRLKVSQSSEKEQQR